MPIIENKEKDKDMSQYSTAVKEPVGTRLVKWWQQFIYQWQLQLMIIPGLIAMIVFNYIPIYGLVLAFQHYTVVDTIGDAPWVGLENFRIIAKDKYFGTPWLIPWESAPLN